MYLTYPDHFQAKETLSRPFKAIKAKAKAAAKVNRFWVVCTNLEQLVVFKITSNFFGLVHPIIRLCSFLFFCFYNRMTSSKSTVSTVLDLVSALYVLLLSFIRQISKSYVLLKIQKSFGLLRLLRAAGSSR